MTTFSNHKQQQFIKSHHRFGLVVFWLLLVLSCQSFGQFAGGSGTLADPYQVSNVDQLQAIRNAPNSAHFILINDIDASATEDWNNGQGFNPIGWFNGSFNGQGYSISDLTINRPNTSQAALFNNSGSAALIKDFSLIDVTIVGGERAASVIGTLAGIIQDVSVSGSITGSNLTGGIAGQIDGGGSITNSQANVNVTGTGDRVGGIVGLLNSGATADNVTATGTVTGRQYVGGVTGQANSGSSITNSQANVNVTGTDIYIGGIVGQLNSNATADNVTATGTVTGRQYVGGVTGQANSGSSITSSSADMTVTGTDKKDTKVGGLVGWNNEGTIENSSSAGSVNGADYVGGLVGHNAGLIKGSHSSSDVDGDLYVGGLVGHNHNSTIETSSSTGNVIGDTDVGGLVGFSGWGGSLIRLSFSSSDVTASGNQAGGLVGRLQSGTVENSYAVGDVEGNNRVGGFIGLNAWGNVANSFSSGAVSGSGGQTGGFLGFNNGGAASNSFWDNETSGQTDGVGSGDDDGVTGKPTEEMRTETTFTDAGWDFENIWSIDPTINNGYPHLIPNPPSIITKTYYSRTNGAWSSATTWSTENHSGSEASQPPGNNDTAIIGAGHIVTFTSNTVNNNMVLVDDTGVLVTNAYHIAGAGNFILAAGGTLHIGSELGISASGGDGSIKTVNRSFSNAANYVYDGTVAQITGNGLPSTVNNLRINNGAGVTASANLTGLTVNGQLQLDNGLFIMPPGSSLVANNVDKTNGDIRMQLVIDGLKGWRMITSPVQTNFNDLLDGFVSQGFGGSTFPNKQPNILWFDESEIGTTNMAWRAPESLNNNVTGGRGYFFYVFNGAEMSENGTATGQFYDDTLPVTMDATGLEHATGGSVFDFGITYHPRSESNITDTDIPEMNTGWNLVGNPSTASLNWDATSGWTRTNVDETIYIWDPAANNGNGDFLYWNGTTGTLNNGLIAPFQAFWVRANNQNPLLTMTDDVKTTGANFVGTGFDNKAQQVPKTSTDLVLTIEAGGMESTSFVSFSDDGRLGEDPRDAYCLESLSENWLKVFTTAPGFHLPMLINNLPSQLDDILHIPVYLCGQYKHEPIAGTYKLSWTMPEDWPAHWQAVLMDHAQKRAVPMGDSNSLSFLVNQANQGTVAHHAPGGQLTLPGNIVAGRNIATNTGNTNTTGGDQFDTKTIPVNISPSFSIVIYPGDHPEEFEYQAPEPSLLPIYPNPVRDLANIRFSLPEASKVTINIYDLYGRRLQQLTDRNYGPGIHSLSWSPGRVSTGLYFIVMESGKGRETQKIVVR